METPEGVPFEPWRRTAPSLRANQDDHGFNTLRTAVARSRSRFVLVNAVGWAAAIGVPPLTGISLRTATVGGLPLCMVLFAAYGCLLLVTAQRFDRETSEACQAWRDGQVASLRAGGEDRW
ncbi:hypothetical protein ACPYPG_03930 [Streptomyces sp. FR-108]|uniref:hypothetical protein n=1 Tax=Streptomyces sp. FR-108 TaxID=3416665 RepID=UPI003CF7E0A1